MHAPQVTRRSLFLLVIGGIFAAIGYGYAAGDIPPGGDAYAAALSLTSLNVWGYVWCAAGLVGAVCGFWPRGRDVVGFIALGLWATFWSVMCFWSTIAFEAERGWVAGLIWLGFTVAVVIVAGMDRPGKVGGSRR